MPKGIVHGHGGILLEHLKALGLCLDLRAGDRYFFHSSTSWMAWNYLVGGLLHGATIVLYDGSPAHPEADALWHGRRADAARPCSAWARRTSPAAQKAGVELGAELDLERAAHRDPDRLAAAAGRLALARRAARRRRARIDSICGGTDVCTAFFGGSPLLPVRAGEISAAGSASPPRRGTRAAGR